DGVVYAVKSLTTNLASKEYAALRAMESKRLPVVTPVGLVQTETEEGEAGVLITRYLDHSLPYHQLFLQSMLSRYRISLLDALAGLLVELHLAGVYWGDCSLFNALFLRDAGRLRAYLVDAETSEVHDRISDTMRDYELQVMFENVTGGMSDLVALGALPKDEPVERTAQAIEQRYRELWDEVSREELLVPADRYRIQERVRRLNALGFSVGDIELTPEGDKLKFKVAVTDRSFHRDLLHSLTGVDAQENQAREMMNEIQEQRAYLGEVRGRSMSLSAAGFHWLEHVFQPAVTKIQTALNTDDDGAELYIQLLEHKWYLSERAQRDVGHDAAVQDFIEREGPRVVRPLQADESEASAGEPIDT
ncbi:MAG: DUF4032 domain-containing protein, partial [Myxococcota bacterium]